MKIRIGFESYKGDGIIAAIAVEDGVALVVEGKLSSDDIGQNYRFAKHLFMQAVPKEDRAQYEEPCDDLPLLEEA